MAIAVTRLEGIDDFSGKNLASRNVQFVYGTFNYDSASSTALTITATELGLTRIDGLFLNSNPGGADLPSAFGVAKVNAYEWTVAPMVVFASATLGTIMASSSFSCTGSVTGVPFMAWGYR